MNILKTTLAAAVAATGIAGAAEARCPSPRGDLAPGQLDESTTPPTHRVDGDGSLDVADVLVGLRAAVGLTRLAHGQGWPTTPAANPRRPSSRPPRRRCGWTGGTGDGRPAPAGVPTQVARSVRAILARARGCGWTLLD